MTFGEAKFKIKPASLPVAEEKTEPDLVGVIRQLLVERHIPEEDVFYKFRKVLLRLSKDELRYVERVLRAIRVTKIESLRPPDRVICHWQLWRYDQLCGVRVRIFDHQPEFGWIARFEDGKYFVNVPTKRCPLNGRIDELRELGPFGIEQLEMQPK